MKTPELGIIALTPQAWAVKDAYPGIAIAAARAGAIGIMDLEYFEESDDLSKCIDDLLACGSSVGIRCGAEQIEHLKPQIKKISESQCTERVVILCVRDRQFEQKSLSAVIAEFHKLHFKVFVECVSLTEAKLAEAADADALIAKGHEASGRVGEETSYVLLQRLRPAVKLPIWIQGGVGINTAAAVLAGGGSGVVLHSQLLLTRESPLTIEQKEKLSNFDGTETEIISNGQEQFRVWNRPGDDSLKMALSKRQSQILKSSSTHKGELDNTRNLQFAPEANALPGLLRHFLQHSAQIAKSQLPSHCPLGQDIAFAAALARKYQSVASVIAAIRAHAKTNLELAKAQHALAEDSPLAASHGCKYPVLQGAMTRVSDTAEFAYEVQKGGGLPFLALSLMRKSEIEPLLEQCSKDLAGGTWGVGLLGFVPPELRQEQLQVVLKHKPPCALIAGGRPDQAKELEALGIKTYLHVPSPVLLESFIELGAKRFIFEGKECGGHVGPRSSFVLWESMIDVLLTSIPPKANPSEYHIVFAGGIHDTISSAMVAALAAPLVERGICIGVLMGTAYLFTKEAVSAGAIVEKFQEAALKCEDTVLLETGPGHAIRCIDSPYKKVFDDKRKKLESEGMGKNELRQELELMNLGRLRVASKGLARGEAGSGGSKLVKVANEKQWADGMYMIGQVASMHNKVTSIKDLHESVSNQADMYLQSVGEKKSAPSKKSYEPQHEPIAIVGMSCLFPKANDLETYWQNILNKVDTIEEVPIDQWDWTKMYNENPLEKDKIYSKWGGFLKDIPFDPSSYGIPPASLASVDPMQLLILEVTRAALQDAGYQKRAFPKERTSIVLANAGHGPITSFYGIRAMLDWTLSDLDPEYRKKLEARLPEWTEDSFPGYLGNVVAGRVANRFDLGGINFCVDAACASSLAALYIGMKELRAGSSDMVLLAATDTHNQPGDFLSFSKTHALSPRGRCRTFDASADGIVISEGMAVLVLKRLSDAERDGDRIYALVRGIGGSSDGRDLSLTAPRPAGQMVALERAYDDAGVSPSTVGLVEAHGTGTVAGDKAEFEALRRVFEEHEAAQQVCALGSVKTMIGHTKCAAGLASVIKVARALYHKVLPPTMGVENPNPACNFESSPFFINTEVRPWIHNKQELQHPRRAGVSAFGFGGTNFHTVLEEYEGQKHYRQESAVRDFPTELFTLRTASRTQLEKQIESLENNCKKMLENASQHRGPSGNHDIASLFELAYRHHLVQSSMPPCANTKHHHHTLAVIASSGEDLLKKLELAKSVIKDESKKSLKDPRGVFFEERLHEAFGKVAFLFPGQGSQQLNMLGDLSLSFACVRETFETADRVLAEKFTQKLSRFVFPTPVFNETGRKQQRAMLTDTHVAQPAIAAADIAAYSLMEDLGIKPDMCAGHSFGEYVALCAAGTMNTDDLFRVSEARGHILKSTNGKKSGSMAAVAANGNEVRRLIAHLKDVTLANLNSPKQCIISGEVSALDEASRVLDENKVKSKPIAVSAAFHSPLMEPALKALSKAIVDVTLHAPEIPVYSNTLAKPYPSKPEQIASLLCDHLVKPVEFQQMVEQMYEAGARIFVECGPGTVLTGLVSDILDGKEHLTLSLERNGKHGITQLQHLIAQALIAGVDADQSKLYKHRVENILPEKSALQKSKPKLMYLINGSHVKRFDGKNTLAANRPAEEAVRHARLAADNNQSNAREITTQTPAAKPVVSSSSTAAKASQVQGSIAPKASSYSATGSQQVSPPHKNGSTQPELRPNTSSGAQSISQPPSPAVAGTPKAQVMMEFQRSMLEMTNSFLQTQEKVMMSYLQRGGQNGANAQNLMANNSALQAQQSAQTKHMPANSNDLQNANQQTPKPQTATYTPGNGTHPTAQPTTQAGAASGNGSGDRRQDGGSDIHHDTAAGTNGAKSNGNGGNGNGNGSHGIDSEKLIIQLIEIVSERTGYPADMLDPSLDLEADLGIDSIKRVEILNNFRKLLPEEIQNELEGSIEKLAGTRTLSGITDWIRSDLADLAKGARPEVLELVHPSRARPNASSAKVETRAAQTKKTESLIGRALVKMQELPALAKSPISLTGLYLISDSEDGLAEMVATKLKTAGAKTLILKHKPNSGVAVSISPSSSKLEIDLCSQHAVEALNTAVSKQQMRIAGLIHLLPLAARQQVTPSREEKEQGYLIPRSLFTTVKELLVPLAKSNEGFKLIAATSLGGSFGLESKYPVNPIQAASAGMIKSISREFPSSLSRCLDFEELDDKFVIAQAVLTELGNTDKSQVEVAYKDGKRFTPVAVPSPIQDAESAELDLDSSSVVLVTGGARGITAELCLEIAEQHKPHFVIIGRGARPVAQEDPQYKGLSTVKELKAAIMDRLRKEGKTLSVPAIEHVYQQLIKDREIRNNLAKIEATGAKVHYYSLDVRDHAAFSNLLDKLYDSFGKIDVVIQGAGVIEDAFLKDKSLESFDRVFSTKIDAALTLASRLDLDSLKYLVLFSSVVGRTGNAGQIDYVAANEVLNKLAIQLNNRSNARVLSIGWGPWRGGMAQAELESVFARFGWSMIEAMDGRKNFYQELSSGKKADAEVLLVGMLPQKHDDSNGANGTAAHIGGNGAHASQNIKARGARLHRAEVVQDSAGSMLLRLRIDTNIDTYLNDHTFNGMPVLPMAVATELLAEAAQFKYSEFEFRKLVRLDIPQGIVIESGAKDLYISLQEESRTDSDITVNVSLSTGTNQSRKNFIARAVLSRRDVPAKLPADSLFTTEFVPSVFIDEESDLPTVDFIYDNWMFHGPLFQGISNIHALGKNGISGKLKSTPINQALKESGKESWLIDPLLMDSAMQLAGIWARHYMDITVLPVGFKTLHLFSSPVGKNFNATVKVPNESKNGELLCDLAVYDEVGRLIMLIEGLGGTGSKSLNRLAKSKNENSK